MSGKNPQAQAASDRVASGSPKRKDQGLWTIFRWPLALGVLSLIGLVGALLTDGPWDWIFAALIATCVAAVVWCWRVLAGLVA